MFFKRLLALFCTFALLACVPVAHAEQDAFAAFAKVPETITYQGGVVIRGYVKGADTSLPALELAYALTSMPYIVIGQPTTWEVIISGGTGDYTCQANLFRQDLNASTNSYSWAGSVNLTGTTFEYTFTKEGRYFWQFSVLDNGGEFFAFQTRPYESHTADDETDATTVAGKANWVVNQVIKPGMSIYDRALALHDWLIYNANYDYTYTNYDASGVLLKGTGVCDSYARAYLMLCTIAGIDCIYVSGTAGSDPDPKDWGAHGWNMIRLDDGKWYHVDCTWDDPNEGGGYERHTYFCVDDETLAKDHRWNRPDDIFDEGFLPPESEDGEYEADDTVTTGYYDFTFSTWEEFFTEFDKMIAAGMLHEKTYGLYTGSLTSSEMWNAMGPYANAKTQEIFDNNLANSAGGCGHSGDLFYYQVHWRNPSSYINIPENTLRVTVGENTLIIPSEYYPLSNAFTWTSSDPSIATVTASYTADSGLIATVTGVSAGTATITVKPDGGLSDTVTITVLPAYTPDFDFSLTESDGKIKLNWNTIPGITEYQIIRVANGTETVLATTHASEYELTNAQLPADTAQQVYILAQRKVASEVTASYKSKAIAYGKFTPTFTSSLPAAMTKIGAEAFADCTQLISFDIPSGVTSIGSRAFAGCTNLTTIRIPASVTSIGTGAFSGCPIQYAVVEQGSFADLWLQEAFRNIQLIY